MREASAVPIDHKLMIRALSDDHGFPALSATLASPAGTNAAYDAAADRRSWLAMQQFLAEIFQ